MSAPCRAHKYNRDTRRCFAIESTCGDAREFAFPPEPLVVYLFNPLPEAGLVEMVGNLGRSVRENPRPVFVLYYNPLLEHVLAQREWLRKLRGTHQYSIFNVASRVSNVGSPRIR